MMPLTEDACKPYLDKCGVCNSNECDRGTYHYCNQCQDYLCNSCRHDHEILDDLKNHEIKSGLIQAKDSTVSDDRKLNDLQSHGISPGQIMDNFPGNSDAFLLDDILELNFKPKSDVNARSPEDKEVPRISGCAFLSTGELLLCDWRNSKLKLLDYSSEIRSILALDGPHAVALVDDNTAVVTMPFKRKLQYVSLKPELTEDKTVSFDTECWGAAVAGDEIFLSCYTSLPPHRPSDIRVLDIQGNETRRLGLDRRKSCLFKTPLYMTVTLDGLNLYVSDFEKNTVTCLQANGDVAYKYNDRLLQGPYGMYVDLKGNIIICSRGSYTPVHVVTARGERHKVLPTSEITKPMCVSFRPSDSTLVFGTSDSAYLTVFQMTPD